MTDEAIPRGEDTLLDRLKSKQSFLLFLALAALAVVPVYASNGTVVLLAVGALAGMTAALAGRLKGFIKSPIGIFLVLFLSWIAFSLAWTISTDDAPWLAFIMTLLSFVGFAFVAAVRQLGAGPAQTAQNILLTAAALMIGLFIIEAATGGVVLKLLGKDAEIILNTVGRGTTILAAFIWPVFALAWARFQNKSVPVAFLIGSFVATYLLPVDAAFAALIAGTVTFLAVLAARRAALAVLFSIFALSIATGPWLSLNILNPDALAKNGIAVPENRQHRLLIWQFVSSNIAEKPLVGHGFGAAREIGRSEQQRYDALQARQAAHLSIHEMRLPLHPHNIPLQIWLELGAVGILFYLGILFGIGRRLWYSTAPPVWIAAAAAGTIAYLSVSLLSFGAWQNWWVATAWLAAGLLVLARRTFQSDTTPL
ncbi:MAG: O-antigen ligase family protein [Rhodospirillales bacterium]